MTESQMIVLDILKSSLWGQDINIPKALDWNQVFEDMKVHTVSELCADWIKDRNDVSEDLKKKWSNQALIQLGVYYRVIFEQQSLYKLMSDNGIPIVILKGTSAAMYYKHPKRRRMGDIDFIVKDEDIERATSILESNGYICPQSFHISNLHMTYLKNKIEFELHRRIPGISEGEEWEKVGYIFKDVFDDAEIHSLNGYKFASFPHIQNGLVLLLHIKGHLKRGLGLRQIIDWMMFVDGYLNDEHWRAFESEAKKLGISNFAKTVTRLCQIYLGLTDSDITWCANADETKCSQLLDWIMRNGNFGRGDTDYGNKGRSSMIVKRGFFKRLVFMQRKGLNEWEAAKKCFLLRPFAWMHELVRYLKYIFGRPHAIKELICDYTAAKRQSRFIDRLME